MSTAATEKPESLQYQSVIPYRARVGLSVHEYVLSFCKPLVLFSIDQIRSQLS